MADVLYLLQLSYVIGVDLAASALGVSEPAELAELMHRQNTLLELVLAHLGV